MLCCLKQKTDTLYKRKNKGKAIGFPFILRMNLNFYTDINKKVKLGASFAYCIVFNPFTLLLEMGRFQKLGEILPHYFIYDCKSAFI